MDPWPCSGPEKTCLGVKVPRLWASPFVVHCWPAQGVGASRRQGEPLNANGLQSCVFGPLPDIPMAGPGGLSLQGVAARQAEGQATRRGVSPCRWVRGEHYRYKFSRPGGQHAAAGKWWVRKRIGPYFPPLSLRDLEDYFRSREWPYPELE